MASVIVYVLKSKLYNKSYVGITDDIDERIAQHNAGHSSYTKRFMPWIVLYKENYPDKVSAHKRELYLKTTSGRRWLKTNIFNK